MSRSRETVIVGGGVIGLALGWELRRLGREVVVLERHRVGSGATSAAGGMLAPISEADAEAPELVRFGIDSLERFPPLVAAVEAASDLSCGYRTEGTLWVAVNRDDREELTRLEEILRERGFAAARLDSSEIAAEEPHLSSRILGGLRVAGDHQVDPRRLSAALARGIERCGVRVLEGMQVDSVEAERGRIRSVRGYRSDGTPFRWDCDEVVLAAGAWSFRGVELPIEDPGLRPIKGQLLRLRGEALISHVVRTPDVYLVPRRDGELLIGATTEEMGFDGRPTAGATMDLLRHAWEALPGCYELAFDEVSVGFRSALDDQLPRIGPTEVEGLYLALGHYRHGILLAPATAHYLARAIVEERPPEALDAFLPFRVPAVRMEEG